ncbi:MAG TPA: hypothetical protein VH092_03505, partial [Urbifossiella sp.]|nr:hypothetical protein [Urbifossiella sp.]
MTALPALVDQNGRPIPLDRQLASGGEGAVYTLPNDAGLVAKVYHKPPSPQTAEKLAALIGLGNPQLVTLAAWPIGLLFHARSRQIAGFVMPRLQDCQPVQHLYNPVQRLKSFPRAGWNFQIRAALNLAAAFEEVHKAGCLVGDVNQSNALASTQALVRLIDCDSFQVRANGRQYLCEVGVPHYTPPELQGKPLRGLTRTENHDRFGLAVLIYQLLFVGRHPYMGVYRGPGDPSFEKLIGEFRFAQGPAARSWDMEPPPHTPTFADIPPEVGALFRRAFERGSEAGNRPSPAEWVAVLRRLEAGIAECPADPGHTYWRGAGGCVWCRLAARGGPEYYFGVAGDSATFVVDDAKLREVTQRLASTESPDLEYNRDRFLPMQAPRPVPLPDDLDEHRSLTIILQCALGLCGAVTLLGFYRGFFAAIGILGAVALGLWLAVVKYRSPWRREYTRRRRAYTRVQDDLHDLEDEWQRVLWRYRKQFDDLSRTVERAVAECRGLTPHYESEIRRMSSNAEAQARLR